MKYKKKIFIVKIIREHKKNHEYRNFVHLNKKILFDSLINALKAHWLAFTKL